MRIRAFFQILQFMIVLVLLDFSHMWCYDEIMKTITFTVTLAFAVARKRKIFLDENIQSFFKDQALASLHKYGVTNIQLYFRSYGVVIQADLPIGITPEMAVKIVKRATTGKMRKEFPELRAMNALWTKKYWWTEGALTEDQKIEMDRFFDYQSAR